MAAVSDVDRLTTLFKRAQGFTNLNTNYALNQETVVSRPAVMADRVFTDTVPAIPPSDLGAPTNVTGGGTKQTSAAYPYLAKYSDVPLLSQDENPKKTFSTNAGGVNLLTNILLPRVSDATPPTDTYAILVVGEYPISQANYILDRDAGRIMIFDGPVNATDSTVQPYISFWRYEGATLADGGGGGGPNLVAETLTLNTTEATGALTAINMTTTPRLAFLTVGQSSSKFSAKYSYDGTEWYNVVSSNFGNGVARSIGYNGFRWVAVGENTGPLIAAIRYSDDGIIWNNANGITTGSGYYSVAWANGWWVAVGFAPIRYSNDGINWNVSAPGFASNGRKVLWDGRRWIVVGNTPVLSFSITNGQSWTSPAVTGFFNSGQVYSLAYDGSWYIAVGEGDATTSIRYSQDCLTWITDSSSNGFTTRGNDVYWNGYYFVAVGQGGATIKYLQNPSASKIWTDATNVFTTVGRSISWNPLANDGSGMWIAAGNGSNGDSIKYSTTNNGSIWVDASGSSVAGGLLLGVTTSNTIDLGRVGIGTISPTEPLDVCGDAKVRGSLYVGSSTAGAVSSGTLTERDYNFNNTRDTIVIESGARTYNNSVGSILFKTADSNNALARIAAVDVASNGGVYRSDLVLQTGYDVNTIDRLRLSNNNSDALGTNLTVGSGTNPGNATDTTTYGLERSRNVIQFPAYRDVTPGRIGANIAGINKQTYTTSGTDTSLIQSTDLAFYTVPPNAGNSIDDTVERMRITDTGDIIAYKNIGVNLDAVSGGIRSYNLNKSNGIIQWSLGMNVAPTGSNNVGNNFSLYRYADNGNFLDTAVFIERSMGKTGIGTVNPVSSLHVNGVGISNNIENKLIMVGETFTNSFSIKFSRDNGATWITASNTFLARASGIAYGNNLWVAVGNNGTGPTIKYSTNGEVWTDVAANYFTSSGGGVEWNGIRWVAVGSGGSTIKYSSDGISWIDATSGTFTGLGNNVRWNGTLWVAVGSGVSTIKYSSDGISWTDAVATNTFTFNGQDVNWNGSMWIAVGSNGNNDSKTIKYSYNAANWFDVSSGAFTSGGSGIAWSSTLSMWVAAGNGTGSTLKYSYDGLNWYDADSGAFTGVGTSVKYYNDRWYATGYDGTGGGNTFKYSLDGKNWFNYGDPVFRYGLDITSAISQVGDLSIKSMLSSAGINSSLSGIIGNGTTSTTYWRTNNTYYKASATGSSYFTGQHANVIITPTITTETIPGYVGMIVSSADIGYVSYDTTGNQIVGKSAIWTTEALPKIKLTDKDKDKAVWGVLTNHKNDSRNSDGSRDLDTDTEWEKSLYGRVRVNGSGEGAIWITNIAGPLENGDYICSSVIPGYGRKQDDDLLHNYTVAKITMSCDFSLDQEDYRCEELTWEGQTYRRAYVGCTYHCS